MNVKKQRAFLVFYTMGIGGVQTKMIDLANALVKQGAECWVLLDEKGEHDRIGQLDVRVRVIVCWDHPMLANRPFRRLRRLRYIFFVIVMTLLFHPRCLFISMCTLALPITKFFQRFYPGMLRRIIINEDTYPSLELSYNHPLWGRSRISDVYPHVKRVIAVSKSTYIDLQNSFHLPSPPLVYLPNWTSFQNTDVPLSRLRPIDIVYGGRFDSQKQPTLMMDLIEALFVRLPGLMVRLYGDGTFSSVIDRRIVTFRSRYNIQRKKPIGNFGPVLRQAKVFIFTSLYEGLPFVGIEAMKNGTVIAALDAPGVRDLVTHGKTGILAPTITSLASQIGVLLRSPKSLSRMRSEAYEYAKEQFSDNNRSRLIQMMLES